MPSDRILIVGTGAFGLAAGKELALRGFRVILVDPTGPTPHAQASSRDVSKIVRSEYWDDADYTDMAEESIDRWLQLNEEWGQIYHHVGVALLAPAMTAASYEGKSFALAQARGKSVARLNADDIRERFPMFRPGAFNQGYFNPRGGFVEALRALEHLRDDLTRLGAEWHLGRTVTALETERGACHGVTLDDGSRIRADRVVVAAGAWTGALMPEMAGHARPTGQPILHLAVADRARYAPPDFCIVMPDIEHTGQYILPLHPREQVVKVGLHSTGLALDPVHSDRVVEARIIDLIRKHLDRIAPELAQAPIVDSRICFYHDTQDYHFWIDRHPDIRNVTVACGGSGHAFKFTPVLGEIIADAVEGIPHRYAAKFRWREPMAPEAAYKGERLPLNGT